MIEARQVLDVGTLRQDDHPGIRMPGENPVSSPLKKPLNKN